jgi:hypothetical protein
VSTTEIVPSKHNLPERRKYVALGVEAGKLNRAMARELGCDEKLVRNDRIFLATPIEDRPVKKSKKVRPVPELSLDEIRRRRVKEMLGAAKRWIADESLQLTQIEYAVHEAGKLLHYAGDMSSRIRVPAGTAYELFAKAQPVETAEHQTAGDLDFWAIWLARWLALCAPGDENLQDEVRREISIRARSSSWRTV